MPPKKVALIVTPNRLLDLNLAVRRGAIGAAFDVDDVAARRMRLRRDVPLATRDVLHAGVAGEGEATVLAAGREKGGIHRKHIGS
jgi:hypothetical protein